MNHLDNLIWALLNADELFVFYERNYADKKIKEFRKRYELLLLEIKELNEEIKAKNTKVFENYLYKENLRHGGSNGIASGTEQI